MLRSPQFPFGRPGECVQKYQKTTQAGGQEKSGGASLRGSLREGFVGVVGLRGPEGKNRV